MLSKHKKYILAAVSIIIFIIYLSPIYWMVISALKPQKELLSAPPTLWPKNITLEPFRGALESGFFRYLGNSVLIASVSTLIAIILGSLAAYAIVRLEKKWLRWVILIFLTAQMLPSILTATPLFIIFKKIGLIDTYTAVILANTTTSLSFAVIALRPVFMQIPKELEEAALIDGCGRIRSLFQVIFPVAQSGIVVVAVISFMFAFGDFIYALSFLYNKNAHPATLGLYNFMGAQIIQWNYVMAFASLTALPLVIIFVALQREIVKGLAAGAFK